MRTRLTSIALLALVLVAPAVAQDRPTLKIGVSTRLSGPSAVIGDSDRKSITMAIDELNAAGGVAGYKLEAIYADNKGVPSEAVAVARRLADVDQVLAIVDSAGSSGTLAVMPVIQQLEVVNLAKSSTNPRLYAMSGKGGNAWAFRINIDDTMIARSYAGLRRPAGQEPGRPRLQRRLRAGRRPGVRADPEGAERPRHRHRVLRPRGGRLPAPPHAAPAGQSRGHPLHRDRHRQRRSSPASSARSAGRCRSSRAATSPRRSSCGRSRTIPRWPRGGRTRTLWAPDVDAAFVKRYEEKWSSSAVTHGALGYHAVKGVLAPGDRAGRGGRRRQGHAPGPAGRAREDRGPDADRHDQVRRAQPGLSEPLHRPDPGREDQGAARDGRGEGRPVTR